MDMSPQRWIAQNLLRIFKVTLLAGAASSVAGAALSPRASTLISWTYVLTRWTVAVMVLAMITSWLTRKISGVALKTRTSTELAAAIETLPMSEKMQLLARLVAGWLAFYTIGWVFGVIVVLLYSSARHAE